jgi:hypothetical protein
MTDSITFDPSHLRDFTQFIIDKCIEDTHFNFLIFPLFMKFLLPFNSPQECIKKLDIDLEFKSDYKNYSLYFKTLFDYYNLLSQKHILQCATLDLFDIISDIDTPPSKEEVLETEGTTSQDPSKKDPTTLDTRQPIIDKIRQNYKVIAGLDSQIKAAAKHFDTVFTWDCNDLHLAIINNNTDPLITNCIDNMNKAPFSIVLDTIIDDPPEIIFKKFVKVICTNFNTAESFNDAKFWVLSQLFIKL